MSRGRDPTGQALAVPVEPASGLAPSGFDPSRADAELGAIELAAKALITLDAEGRARAITYLRALLIGDHKALRQAPMSPERQIEALDHVQQVIGELAYDVARARS